MKANDNVESREREVSNEQMQEWVEDALHEGKYHVPASIREQSIWICYRIEENDDGSTDKVPKVPTADGIYSCDPTDPESNGATYAESLKAVGASREKFGNDGHDGVGLCLDGDERLVGVDFDGVRRHPSGDVKKWALNCVQTLGTYSEVSPSNNGLHSLGFVPDGLLDDFGNRNDELGIEIYEEGRYFTFSARSLAETPNEIRDVGEEVRTIQRKYMKDQTKSTVENDEEDDVEENESESEEITRTLSDDDEYLIEKAKKFDDEFGPLWEGRTQNYPGDTQSRSDYSLIQKLLYWTKGDADRAERLFRKSGLMREKWTEKRGSQTYGEITMENAVADYDGPGSD